MNSLEGKCNAMFESKWSQYTCTSSSVKTQDWFLRDFFCFRPVSPQHPGIFIPCRGEEIFLVFSERFFAFLVKLLDFLVVFSSFQSDVTRCLRSTLRLYKESSKNLRTNIFPKRRQSRRKENTPPPKKKPHFFRVILCPVEIGILMDFEFLMEE